MRSERSKRRILTAAVLAGVIVLAALGAVLMYEAQNISFAGNTIYSDEELKEMLFSGYADRNYILRSIKGWFTDEKEIPFIDRVEVSWGPERTMEVVVYEKEIIGYITYMGSIMYFDRDGYVVESSSELIRDVPEISGLEFSQIVLGEKLDVGDEKAFTQILNLTQWLREADIDADDIFFDDDFDAYVTIGKIRTALGSMDYMQEKIAELSGILKALEGREGTLYLDTYDPYNTDPSYLFKEKQ